MGRSKGKGKGRGNGREAIKKEFKALEWWNVSHIQEKSFDVYLLGRVIRVTEVTEVVPEEEREGKKWHDVVLGDATGFITLRITESELSVVEVGQVVQVRNANPKKVGDTLCLLLGAQGKLLKHHGDIDFTLKDVTVGWFRNDLRTRDNPMLEEVLSRAKSQDLPAVLVYIFDPRFYDRSLYGRVTDPNYEKSIESRYPVNFCSRKCNGRRARFYLNVLRDLHERLKELGVELWFFYGKPEEIFKKLSEQYGALDVVCLREPVSPEWTDVEDNTDAALKETGGSLTRLWGAMSLYHEDDLPFHPKDTPDCYSAVAAHLGWEDIWTNDKQDPKWTVPIRKPLLAPTGPWPLKKPNDPKGAWDSKLFQDDKAALDKLGFTKEEIEVTLKAPHGGSRKGKGGETAAWQRFTVWMEKEPEADQDEFCAWDLPTSGTQDAQAGAIDALQWKNLAKAHGWMQISKYLACGCISPRDIYHALVDKKHWALTGVVHRFMWREWHRLNAIKYHRKLYWLQGHGRQNNVWKNDPNAAQAWKEGRTGIPYIDACMRELNQTGWLAYKGRKTVANFLAMDLWIDWRVGAFHFEEVLLDYDVSMNYGNWSTCVRVDKDYGGVNWRSPGHEDMIHKLQAEAMNDMDGSYIRGWCPELRKVPDGCIHSPWMMTPEQMDEADCVIGKDYPAPLVKAEILGDLGIQEEIKRLKEEFRQKKEKVEKAQARSQSGKNRRDKRRRRGN